MFDEEEDEQNTPRGKFAQLVAMLPTPPQTSTRALAEALYTYSETHEFRIDPELALLMWQFVEWARNPEPTQVEAIRL